MILARISKAIREQNWFAVVLEFIIVILGVVVGFQVTAWNAERLDRADEVRLLSQLRRDVSTEIEAKRDWIADRMERNTALAESVTLLQDPDAGDTMAQRLCNAAWASHIIAFVSSRLSTLDEIMATRGLDSLTDPHLRAVLLEYRGEMEFISEASSFVRGDLANVVDEFADEMPRHLDVETGTSDARCQLDRMRQNARLRNRLISNYGRAGGLVRYAETELALLVAIQDALAQDDISVPPEPGATEE